MDVVTQDGHGNPCSKAQSGLRSPGRLNVPSRVRSRSSELSSFCFFVFKIVSRVHIPGYDPCNDACNEDRMGEIFPWFSNMPISARTDSESEVSRLPSAYAQSFSAHAALCSWSTSARHAYSGPESPCWFWVAPGGKGGQARDAIKAVNAMKEYTTSRKLRRDWAGDEDFKARSGGCGTLPERADESLVIFLRDIRHGKEIDGKN